MAPARLPGWRTGLFRNNGHGYPLVRLGFNHEDDRRICRAGQAASNQGNFGEFVPGTIVPEMNMFGFSFRSAFRPRGSERE